MMGLFLLTMPKLASTFQEMTFIVKYWISMASFTPPFAIDKQSYLCYLTSFCRFLAALSLLHLSQSCWIAAFKLYSYNDHRFALGELHQSHI